MNKYTLSYRFLNGNGHGCVFAKNRPVSLNCTDYTWGRHVQNIVNQRCVAGVASVFKTPVLGIDRSRVPKKAKNVLDAKNNNFHFLRF